MKHRKLLLIVSLVLALTMTLGSTLAYLTDMDSETNTFTMGKVDIELEETFTPDSPLWPGEETDKDAKITNKGQTDAWVWLTVVVPGNIAKYVTPVWAEGITPTYTSVNTGTGEKTYTYLVPTLLPAGQSTDKILDAVLTSSTLDIQDDKLGAVENRVFTEITGDLQIVVNAYAVQAEGIDSVEDAYAAYNAQWGVTGGGSSGDNEQPTEPEVPAGTPVATLTELYEAVKTSGTVVLTDDILLSNTDPSVTIPAGVEVVLNLDDKQLSAGDGNNVIINNGTLTIMGGTVRVPNTHYAIMNYGVLTIDGTTVEIDGVSGIRNMAANSELTIKGTSVIKNEITNKKGVAVTIKIEGGTFSFDPTSYVDTENYTVIPNTDGTYTVTAK